MTNTLVNFTNLHAVIMILLEKIASQLQYLIVLAQHGSIMGMVIQIIIVYVRISNH